MRCWRLLVDEGNPAVAARLPSVARSCSQPLRVRRCGHQDLDRLESLFKRRGSVVATPRSDNDPGDIVLANIGEVILNTGHMSLRFGVDGW